MNKESEKTRDCDKRLSLNLRLVSCFLYSLKFWDVTVSLGQSLRYNLEWEATWDAVNERLCECLVSCFLISLCPGLRITLLAGSTCEEASFLSPPTLKLGGGVLWVRAREERDWHKVLPAADNQAPPISGKNVRKVARGYAGPPPLRPPPRPFCCLPRTSEHS